MTVGTRSVLFGAHQFLLHPVFVALAWWILYGFPWNPLLWCAFFVHDLGYWGKPDMDGAAGEEHPRLGANIMYRLTGKHSWWEFTAYHSRYWARRNGARISRLCVADKYAIVITPCWLWLFLARLSGELDEYLVRSDSKYRGMNLPSTAAVRDWHQGVVDYLRRWVEEHKDGRADGWTPAS
jgi:hypothetical protein